MAKLLSITRGDTRCEHCGRPIKILCQIQLETETKVVGSSCVEKFVPELLFDFNRKFSVFQSSQRREKKRLYKVAVLDEKRKHFEALINGVGVVGENLVQITDREMLRGLTGMLLDDGFTATDKDDIFEGPTAEAATAAEQSYEGVVALPPAESLNEKIEAVEFLKNYTGRFGFYLSLKNQLLNKGFLSIRQIECVVGALAKQKAQDVTPPEILIDSFLVVRRFWAKKLAKEMSLKKSHFTFEITKLYRETEKAVLVELKATGRPAFGMCCACGAMLTNAESIAKGIGPICGDGYGAISWEEVNAILADVPVLAKVWVPRSQIKQLEIKRAA